MRARRFIWLDAWILRWVHAELQCSNALLAVNVRKLFDGFGRQERQQIRASLRRLETQGLIILRRVPGCKPIYLTLSVAGIQWVHYLLNDLAL